MPIIGKFPRKQRKQIPAWIGFQATQGDNTLHLRTQTGGYDCVIDWGDGKTTTAPVNGGNVVHNYKSAGLYDIKISGKSFAGFYVNNQAGKEKYVAAYSMGKWEVDTLTTCFYSFYGCSKLVTLSPNLFRYSENVTTMYGCFMESGIQEVPKSLLYGLKKTSRFDGCFRATNLANIPEALFEKNVLAQSFDYCFMSTKISTIPGKLFYFNLAAKSLNGCFANCHDLTTLPENLFEQNKELETIYSCFLECYNLTLRADIFGTDYANRFNGKTVEFDACFYRSSFTGIQGTAPELWRFTGLTATQRTKCFAGAGNSAASLTNYASIPSDWK